MKKELKKGDVCVKITDKNRENVKGILEMFGEKVYSSDTLFEYRCIIYSLYSCKWLGSYGVDKIIVKPKHLKAILAKEHLKSGDYIVLDNGNEIVKIKSISDGKIYVDKHRMKQSDIIFTDGVESTRDFDRYATEEEIELLECLKINGWYEDCTLPNWLAYCDFTSNKRYGFTVNGSWFRDSNLGFFDKNNITACEKKVEEALINEAKRRYKVGDKVKSLSSSNLDGVLNFEYIYYYTSDDLWISNESTMTCVYRNGKWADVVEVDKLAELKEAHNNGAVIQFKSHFEPFEWRDVYGNKPSWQKEYQYRIKPEEPIKVGDVCKLWDGDDESLYEVGSVSRIDDSFIPYQSTSGLWYINAKKLTKEEAIDLLFNKK